MHPKHTHVPFLPGRFTPAKIAFVGEAPSDEELERGEPLVGPSGKIFNAMLRTAGLERADYWIGNVFDEKLPENSVSNWCAPMDEARRGGFDAGPPIGGAGWLRPDHLWQLARLREELESARPRVIVPLGATALWALTGQDRIGIYRGAVMPATQLVPGAKLLPTYHPMFVVKQWKWFHVVVGDFIKAAAEAERGPEVIYAKKELTLEPDLDELQKWTAFLLTRDPLSVDIETAFGQVTCIGFGDQERAICVPFWDKRNPTRSYWPDAASEAQAWRWCKLILESDTPKLGQNYAAYDAIRLLETYGIRTMGLSEDTRLLHHAIHPELPKSLAFLGAAYTQQGPWKTMGHKAQSKRDDL